MTKIVLADLIYVDGDSTVPGFCTESTSYEIGLGVLVKLYGADASLSYTFKRGKHGQQGAHSIRILGPDKPPLDENSKA